ncbi:hypothetical protein DYB31_003533 [Aphanomyces astaci]|nr:hypothetical protein DYB31_003533 [Aphanomyces astaci]
MGMAVVRLLHEDGVQLISKDVCDEVEAWMTVLMTGMEVHGAGEGWLQVVLPLLLRLSQPTTTGRMLISIATMFSGSFKAAVGRMGEDMRSALQTALRQALVDKTAAAAAAPTTSMSLDFSRYG